MKSKLPKTRKTPRTSKRESRSILINLAPAEPELQARLHLFERTTEGVRFCFSSEPLTDKRDISLFLIPLRHLAWISEPEKFGCRPVFVFGPGYGLYSGFRMGCSDYLKDPWDERELLARAERKLGSLTLDYAWGELVLRNGECIGPAGSIVLSPHEDIILQTLCRFRGRKVLRDVLSQVLWGKVQPESRAVDMHIAGLRRKMKTVLPRTVTTVILTCRPGGYMIR